MYDYNNELYHFGVKGMKWGKRKAQYTIGETRRMSQQGEKRAKIQYHNAKMKAKRDRRNNTWEYKHHTADSPMNKRQIKEQYKADRKAAKQAYNSNMAKNQLQTTKNLSKTSYRSILGESLAVTGVGVLTTAAGKALTNKGAIITGSILEGLGQGVAIGGLAAGTINAGGAFVARRMK